MPEPRRRTASPPTLRLTAGVCIIHLIRKVSRLASKKDWDTLRRDVKPIYTAVNTDAARAALDDLAERWGANYPAIIRLWRNAWAEFIGVPRL
jgi:putative transposase